MLKIEQIKSLLQTEDSNKLSKITKLHPNTIDYIRDGRTLNPSSQTLEKLSDYFEEKYKIINGDKS